MPRPVESVETLETHYTVFVKVPFPRGDFVDPPTVHWDSSKDRALWKILSSSSKDAEIDWHVLAGEFDVTLPFLLQQAAWLYERQLSQVREQLRKVNRPTSSRASPAPESASASTTVGGYAMKRGGSGGSRVPSSLSQRAKDSPHAQSGGPSTPVPARTPGYPRTASTNAVPQYNKVATAPLTNPSRRSLETDRRPDISSDLHRQGDMAPRSPSFKAQSSSSSSASSSSSSDPPAVAHSRAFTRRPRFPAPKSKAKHHVGLLSSADEEDDEASDDSPAFLPFSNPNPAPNSQSPASPSASLRRIPSTSSRKDPPTINTAPTPWPPSANARTTTQTAFRTQPQSTKKSTHSSSSSLSSPFPASNTHSNTISSPGPGNGPTSPPLPLSALSPRTRRIAREGSEGTPSMGSSFSDLDDASVTQSALEEALAREIKQGGGSLGVVGRMGGLWRTRGAGRGGG